MELDLFTVLDQVLARLHSRGRVTYNALKLQFNLDDARDIWRQITAPVLLIKGAESWAPDPDKSGRGDIIPDHRTVTIEKAGHWVHHDQLDGVMAVIEDFLEEQKPVAVRA